MVRQSLMPRSRQLSAASLRAQLCRSAACSCQIPVTQVAPLFARWRRGAGRRWVSRSAGDLEPGDVTGTPELSVCRVGVIPWWGGGVVIPPQARRGRRRRQRMGGLKPRK